jgi:hypothetical protein
MDTTTLPKESKFPTLKRIADNWRELAAFLVIGLGFSVTADFLVGVTAGAGWAMNSIATLTNYLQGFSRFTAVCLCASVLGMTFWPTVARFAEVNFKKVYLEDFTPKEKILVFMGVVAVFLIAAALCFTV